MLGQLWLRNFFSNLEDCPLATEKAPDNSTEADIIALDEAAGTTTKDVQRKANDDRALFYSGCGGGLRGIEFEQIAGFNSGLSIVKWSNIRTDGAPTSHVEFPDVDIPLIRYAEMFLTRAEAKFRLSGDPQQHVQISKYYVLVPVLLHLQRLQNSLLLMNGAVNSIWKDVVAVI